MDPDAVWGGEWVYCMSVHVPQGEGEVLRAFVSIGFNGVFLNRNVFDSCVKSSQYFRMDNTLLETSVHWPSDEIRSRSKFCFRGNL